jgi:hypothetical protein
VHRRRGGWRGRQQQQAPQPAAGGQRGGRGEQVVEQAGLAAGPVQAEVERCGVVEGPRAVGAARPDLQAQHSRHGIAGTVRKVKCS